VNARRDCPAQKASDQQLQQHRLSFHDIAQPGTETFSKVTMVLGDARKVFHGHAASAGNPPRFSHATALQTTISLQHVGVGYMEICEDEIKGKPLISQSLIHSAPLAVLPTSHSQSCLTTLINNKRTILPTLNLSSKTNGISSFHNNPVIPNSCIKRLAMTPKQYPGWSPSMSFPKVVTSAIGSDLTINKTSSVQKVPDGTVTSQQAP
jgi:hypothetical protein